MEKQENSTMAHVSASQCAPKEKTPIIKVTNLVKTFKTAITETQVLKELDFEAMQGEITVILGASGSGKTTLQNCISGLDVITSGQIDVDGVKINELKPKAVVKWRRENISFIFQQYNLIKDLTVKENVMISSYLSKDPLDVDEVLEIVGLKDYKDFYPYQLSGGMQQRVAIARAVVKSPKILFCDEPTGALDENMGREVLALLAKLNCERNISIVMITHNPGISKMAHRTVHLKLGKIDSVIENDEIIDAHDVAWG